MILEFKGLSKSYKKNQVLKDIDLSLQGGKFYALLGRNGSGKSTLMKILMRFELPDKGSGHVLGFPLSSNHSKANQEIAYISEDIVLGGSFSINRFFRDYGDYYPRWDKDLFYNFLDVQSLDPKKSFNEFSRGQKMQVALAAGLATQPKLLLLDEITSVLDAGARSYFLRYLGEFRNNGGTVVMATNIVSEVQHFAEHLLLLENSKILMDMPLPEVSKNFIKIRKMMDVEIKEIENPNCVQTGINSDGTISYIIPAELTNQYKMEGILPDRRNVTIEELFIYFTAKRRENA